MKNNSIFVKSLKFALAIVSLNGLTSTSFADDKKTPNAQYTQAITQQEQQAVLAYWTIGRMAQAVPMKLLQEREKKSHSPVKASHGKSRIINGVAPSKWTNYSLIRGPLAFPEQGAAWPGSGAVAATTGKLFFTVPGEGGYDGTCSANAVVSENKSTIMTAGHCITKDGKQFENIIFVPGYNNGPSSYGTWIAKWAFTTPQWADGNDMEHDVATIVTNPLNGQLLTDVVGGSGLEFNRNAEVPEDPNLPPYYGKFYIFGYPGNFANAQTLTYCSGDAALLDAKPALGCNMTFGASGGPWFLNFDEKTGVGIQNSVNHATLFGSAIFGSYFDVVVEALYEKTQSFK
ncbi:trypsin-like serine peptidase [Chryseobacterium sp.]|uniref:trypsin-like serine peptidase n=1 Tax=Chryseobacterium sp. TaxID=1871047 RepID=UPI002FC5DF63